MKQLITTVCLGLLVACTGTANNDSNDDAAHPAGDPPNQGDAYTPSGDDAGDATHGDIGSGDQGAGDTTSGDMGPQNAAPEIDLPDAMLEYPQGSDFIENILRVSTFARDAEDEKSQLSFSISAQSATSIADCTLDPLEMLDCNIGGPGTATVEVTVTDTNGASQSDTLAFTVSAHTAACADGIDNDGDLFDDFPYDPGCENANDNDESNGVAAHALVLYNTNYSGGETIANYYAAARSIPSEQIIGVGLPPGSYAKPEHVFMARNAVIEAICELLHEDLRPTPCDSSNVAGLAEVSPFTHLVMTKGIPARLYDHGMPQSLGSSAITPGSFEFYVAHMIYNEIEDFGEGGGKFIDPLGYPDVIPYRGLPAPLSPRQHRAMTYGKIEAATVARTLSLIDRTIAAEAGGITGNILIESEPYGPTDAKFFAGLTDSYDSACFEYMGNDPFIYGDPQSSWDHENCHYATTWHNLDCATLPGCGSSSCGDGETCLNAGGGELACYANCDDDSDCLSSESCQTGVCKCNARRGNVPGESPSTIPNPVDVSLMMGGEYGQSPNIDFNWMSAFDGFNNMLRWRKRADNMDCVPLCSDLTSAPARALCRDQSQDVFKEINTKCVGAAPGFMGSQTRSWPVRYYGFHPQGWNVNGNESVRISPPRQMNYECLNHACNMEVGDDGYKGDTYTDELFLRFGQTEPQTPVCDGPWGSMDCREHIFPALQKYVWLNPTREDITSIDVVVQHRNPANAGSLKVRLRIDADGGGYDETKSGDFDLADARGPAWQQSIVTLQPNATTLRHFRIELFATGDGIRGWLDVDAVEVVLHFADNSSENVMPHDAGSFALRNLHTDTGGYASDVIDRLGGIAWWGSHSHFNFGGWAFNSIGQRAKIVAALSAGRTLGEAWCAGGACDRDGMSGLLYGDPLHRPSGTKIATSISREIGSPFAHSNPIFWRDSELGERLLLNAFNGRAPLAQTSWAIQVCEEIVTAPQEIGTTCPSGWQEFLDGEAGQLIDVGDMWMLIEDITQSQSTAMRLVVRRDDLAGRALYDMGYLRYVAVSYNDCPGDVDDNGVVDEQDTLLINLEPCTPEQIGSYDFSGDGRVDADDNSGVLDNFGACPPEPAACPGDVNGDGNVDIADLLALMANYCRPEPSDPRGDVDEDGDIDETDLMVVETTQGPCPE